MTKYYVYNVKLAKDGERSHAFVEDPILFALKAFDPATMEFSGVFVEANNGTSAQRVYMHPKEDDVFVSCDEPKATVLKRQAFESRMRLEIKQRISDAEYETRRLKTNTLSLEIAMHFNLLATQISEMARQILAMANEEDRKVFTHEIVYNKLLTQYAGQLLQLQYRPRPNGESQR